VLTNKPLLIFPARQSIRQQQTIMLPASTRTAAAAAANGVLRRTAATTTRSTTSTTTSAPSSSSSSSSSPSNSSTKISTIIFDVDDCLYDVSTGFTSHRNGDIIWQYMVDHLHFDNIEDAKKVRDKYFKIYHSTAKALTVAQENGDVPSSAPKFDVKDMSKYWVDHLDYTKLFTVNDTTTVEDSKRSKKELHDALMKCDARLVAFSNGPRDYVQKVLITMGLWDLFGSNRYDENTKDDGKFVFGVDNVLPYCKPEKEAFEKIFNVLNTYNTGSDNTPINPEECIMIEDSMKNVRAAKALGMKTILITGIKEEGRILPCDAPVEDDPDVDVSMATIEEITTRLPGLFNQNPPVFEP
jgi:putative hydrolase of the HAD superfamily